MTSLCYIINRHTAVKHNAQQQPAR